MIYLLPRSDLEAKIKTLKFLTWPLVFVAWMKVSINFKPFLLVA